MAAGVPVVAARATGAVDLIDEGVTGCLVPPRAVDGYSRAIERIVGDTALRRQMGAAGTACAAGYQWETANQAVIDAYIEVMERRTGLTLPATPAKAGVLCRNPRQDVKKDSVTRHTGERLFHH